MLFILAKYDTDTPYILAICDKVSPFLTMYVYLVFCTVSFNVVLLLSVILIFCPGYIKFGFCIPFISTKCAIVTPYAFAICDKVSPLLTVYVILPVPLVSLPFVVEFVSILNTCPGYIKFGFDILLMLAISCTVVPYLCAICDNVSPLCTV